MDEIGWSARYTDGPSRHAAPCSDCFAAISPAFARFAGRLVHILDQRLRQDRSSWVRRHGIAPDFGTNDSTVSMNLNIRGVPVYGFMVLITVFAIVIGPVNYFYLRRKRLLWLLLVTVPATALVTSVLLVGYSVAAHGFSIRSRIRSLTVLD